MMPSDKPEFDKNLEVLFGGFPAFLTEPRKEAYWRGLQKMSLHIFIRCVDHLLGEAAPEKMPTLHLIWQTSKDLRGNSARQQQSQPIQDSRDNFERFADHLFLNYLLRRGGVPENKIPALLEIKRQVTDDFRLIHKEEPIEPEEMQAQLHKRWLAA